MSNTNEMRTPTVGVRIPADKSPTITPTTQSVIDGRSGIVVTMHFFAGGLRVRNMRITLDDGSRQRLRRFQLLLMGMLASCAIGISLVMCRAIADLTDFVSARPATGNSWWPILFLLAALAIGGQFIEKLRPPFYPRRIPGSNQIKLCGLDRDVALEWAALNPQDLALHN